MPSFPAASSMLGDPILLTKWYDLCLYVISGHSQNISNLFIVTILKLGQHTTAWESASKRKSCMLLILKRIKLSKKDKLKPETHQNLAWLLAIHLVTYSVNSYQQGDDFFFFIGISCLHLQSCILDKFHWILYSYGAVMHILFAGFTGPVNTKWQIKNNTRDISITIIIIILCSLPMKDWL